MTKLEEDLLEWAAARKQSCDPDVKTGSPEMRAAWIRLSNAEDALVQHAKRLKERDFAHTMGPKLSAARVSTNVVKTNGK